MFVQIYKKRISQNFFAESRFLLWVLNYPLDKKPKKNEKKVEKKLVNH
jgi:hypothetical protein